MSTRNTIRKHAEKTVRRIASMSAAEKILYRDVEAIEAVLRKFREECALAEVVNEYLSDRLYTAGWNAAIQAMRAAVRKVGEP